MPKISDPISVIAHQLKNPVAIIKEYLEILSSGDAGELNIKQKEYLADTLKNINQMKRIITDLLDVSKVEGSAYKIKGVPVDLIKITKEAVDEFNVWARTFNCEIVFKEPENVHKALTDPEKIREVIENFISNAIRYKKAGHGLVEISIKEKDGKISFFCKDDGIGVQAKDVKKIFHKFFRTDEAMNIEPTGTGLGLYINKAIIEGSGGKIGFKNNKGRGMTFYFILPVAKKNAKQK